MKAYTDANPNKICVVLDDDTQTTRINDLGDGFTNNEAEYEAIYIALMLYPDITEIYSDSKLCVNQLNHKWSIKQAHLRAKAQDIWQLMSAQGRRVTFTWIPRKENLAGRVLG